MQGLNQSIDGAGDEDDESDHFAHFRESAEPRDAPLKK